MAMHYKHVQTCVCACNRRPQIKVATGMAHLLHVAAQNIIVSLMNMYLTETESILLLYCHVFARGASYTDCSLLD